jgi:lipopolysaccharide transport system permease protein
LPLALRKLYVKSVDRLIRQNPVRIFWIYRSFIWRAAIHDLRYRYVGSALGVFWNVLIPLAQILIYTAVFSTIMPVRLPGMAATNAFTIYLCSGLLPWLGFSECVTRGTHCFLENANYLKKLPIPEQVFVAQNAVSATLSLAVSMSLVLLLAIFLGGNATWAWLTVVPAILLLQSMGFGLGLILGSLNVFFRDIGQFLGIGLQMWMWLTPIVYLKDILPDSLRRFLFWNPVFPFIDTLHEAIIHGIWPQVSRWSLMLLWALVTLFCGYLVLKRLRPEIRDVL